MTAEARSALAVGAGWDRIDDDSANFEGDGRNSSRHVRLNADSASTEGPGGKFTEEFKTHGLPCRESLENTIFHTGHAII
jgi:hypothetical protein